MHYSDGLILTLWIIEKMSSKSKKRLTAWFRNRVVFQLVSEIIRKKLCSVFKLVRKRFLAIFAYHFREIYQTQFRPPLPVCWLSFFFSNDIWPLQINRNTVQYYRGTRKLQQKCVDSDRAPPYPDQVVNRRWNRWDHHRMSARTVEEVQILATRYYA